MEEAIARLELASDAGADVLFLEGIASKEDLERTVKTFAPKPVRYSNLKLFSVTRSDHIVQVLLNIVTGGFTPSFTADEAKALGAKLISVFYLDCQTHRHHSWSFLQSTH